MAELVFFTGTMDCGKSTLALQTDHNHAARGRSGLMLSKHGRGGQCMLSSRCGLARQAIEVMDDLICDEAQFSTPLQVEALCWCGRTATHNAHGPRQAEYEVLCRRHFMHGVTSRDAQAQVPRSAPGTSPTGLPMPPGP